MGDGVITSAAERMFEYGILGILVVVFGAVIFLLWKDGKKDRRAYDAHIETLRIACEAEKTKLREEADDEREALMKKLAEVQDSRIADAKAFQQDTIRTVQQATLAIANANTLMDGQRDATLELRGALREQTEELRVLGSDVRERLARRDHGS